MSVLEKFFRGIVVGLLCLGLSLLVFFSPGNFFKPVLLTTFFVIGLVFVLPYGGLFLLGVLNYKKCIKGNKKNKEDFFGSLIIISLFIPVVVLNIMGFLSIG